MSRSSEISPEEHGRRSAPQDARPSGGRLSAPQDARPSGGRRSGAKGIEEEGERVDEQERPDEEEDSAGEGEDEAEEALTPEALAEMCEKCGGRCCKYYTVMLEEPEDADDFDEMRWFLAHEDNYIYVDEGEWHLNVISRCRFLDEGGRCAIYDHRPDVCRDFGRKEECEFTGGFDFEHEFRTIEELEAYARRVLSPEEYEKLPRFAERQDGAS